MSDDKSWREVIEMEAAAKERRDQARGGLDEIARRLRDEFDLTIKDAAAELARLDKLAARQKKEAEGARDKLLRDYGKELDDGRA